MSQDFTQDIKKNQASLPFLPDAPSLSQPFFMKSLKFILFANIWRPHPLLKESVPYIFASFFFLKESLNEITCQTRKKIFLFHFKSSFCSGKNQILEF